MEEILIIFGLGLLGILLYAGYQVWGKASEEGFSPKKFFNDNLVFWLVCIGFNLLLSLLIALVPDSREILHALGFAVEADTFSGYVLLGIALATGSNKTPLTGSKNLQKKKIT